MEVSIYKATINNKSYIGIATNLLKRQKSHKHLSKNPKTHFHRAIQKYGWTNLNWEILEVVHSWDYACIKEQYFIKSYDTFRHGYNMTLGGDGQVGISYPAWNKGKTLSIKYKQKLSAAKKGKLNHNFGKIGESASNFKGWWVTPLGKFPCLREASKHFDVTLASIRNRCLSSSSKWVLWSYQKKL